MTVTSEPEPPKFAELPELTEDEIIDRMVMIFLDLAIRGRELIARDQDESEMRG